MVLSQLACVTTVDADAVAGLSLWAMETAVILRFSLWAMEMAVILRFSLWAMEAAVLGFASGDVAGVGDMAIGLAKDTAAVVVGTRARSVVVGGRFASRTPIAAEAALFGFASWVIAGAWDIPAMAIELAIGLAIELAIDQAIELSKEVAAVVVGARLASPWWSQVAEAFAGAWDIPAMTIEQAKEAVAVIGHNAAVEMSAAFRFAGAVFLGSSVVGFCSLLLVLYLPP